MQKVPAEKMQRYCAFFRGINVGWHTLIKMEELRKTLESLGLKDVKTVLASGNVVFEAPQEDTALLSKNIARKLQELSGREILVIVRSLDDLRELEARQPFKDISSTPKARPFVTFLSETSKPAAHPHFVHPFLRL